MTKMSSWGLLIDKFYTWKIFHLGKKIFLMISVALTGVILLEFGDRSLRRLACKVRTLAFYLSLGNICILKPPYTFSNGVSGNPWFSFSDILEKIALGFWSVGDLKLHPQYMLYSGVARKWLGVFQPPSKKIGPNSGYAICHWCFMSWSILLEDLFCFQYHQNKCWKDKNLVIVLIAFIYF